jgi:hypothetical protein
MALGRHIPINSDLVFPAGAYAVGGVEQVIDFEASTREQRVQAHDRDSGLPTWAISVFDADPEARTKVVRVKISARNPRTLPQAPAGSPFPAVAFEGLTATPYVDTSGSRPRRSCQVSASETRERRVEREIGGPCGIRTHDQPIKSRRLYH